MHVVNLLGAPLALAVALLVPTITADTLAKELVLDQVTGRHKGTRFALRWAPDGSCEAGAASPKAQMLWRKATPEQCRSLRDHLKKNRSALEASQLAGGAKARLLAPGHAPVGVLKLADHRWRANLASGRLCDENGLNCKQPARSPGTELALLLRDTVLKIHGKLGPPAPEWTSVDEALHPPPPDDK